MKLKQSQLNVQSRKKFKEYVHHHPHYLDVLMKNVRATQEVKTDVFIDFWNFLFRWNKRKITKPIFMLWWKQRIIGRATSHLTIHLSNCYFFRNENFKRWERFLFHLNYCLRQMSTKYQSMLLYHPGGGRSSGS